MIYLTNKSNKNITYKGRTVKPMESVLLDDDGNPTKVEIYYEDKIEALDKKVDEVYNNTETKIDNLTIDLQNLDEKVDTNCTNIIGCVNDKVSTVDSKVDTTCTNLVSCINDQIKTVNTNVDKKVSTVDSKVDTACTNLVTCINNQIKTVNTNISKKADSASITNATKALNSVKIPEISTANFTNTSIDVSTKSPLSNTNSTQKCIIYTIKGANNFSLAKEYFVKVSGIVTCICITSEKSGAIDLQYNTIFDIKKAHTVSLNTSCTGNFNLWAKVEPNSTGAKITIIHKNGCYFSTACGSVVPRITPSYFTLSV